MTDLVPVDPFALAAQVSRSNLIPQAYRGKEADTAVCIMYGAEVGLPPMTALQRIVVINGKPTLDAQGMAALIRGHGHSLMGEVTPTEAKVTGKRADNGDTMSFTFTMDDARKAGLVKKGPWTDYPKAMLWARAVSQLARQLFPDVLMGMSYVPEEIGGDPEIPDEGPVGTVQPSHQPADAAVVEALAADDDDTVVDAEVVDAEVVDEGEVAANQRMSDGDNDAPMDPAPLVDTDTGEIIPDPPAAPVASTPQELKVILNDMTGKQPEAEKSRLRAHLLTMFGPIANRTVEQMQKSVNIAAGWPLTADQHAAAVSGGEPF